jgi:hypothetical protein
MAKIVSARLHKRPGAKLVHRFRSNVVGMDRFRDWIIVVLENGKAYRSNKAVTRWYLIRPTTRGVAKEIK